MKASAPAMVCARAAGGMPGSVGRVPVVAEARGGGLAVVDDGPVDVGVSVGAEPVPAAHPAKANVAPNPNPATTLDKGRRDGRRPVRACGLPARAVPTRFRGRHGPDVDASSLSNLSVGTVVVALDPR